MKYIAKIILLITVFLTFAQIISAATTPTDTIILKTGEVYTGEIVLQNDDIILIRTLKGERFQFPASEIKSINKISEKTEEILKQRFNEDNFLPYHSDHNFSGMIEISGGNSMAKNRFSSSSTGEATLSFGTRSITGKSLFAGIGAGYSFFSTSPNEMSSFVPVFIRLQSNNLSHWRTSPFFSIDAGYAFPLKTTMSGGFLSKFTAGFVHRLNFKTSVQLGLFTRVQQFNDVLSENLNGSVFTYSGNSAIILFGAMAGFHF